MNYELSFESFIVGLLILIVGIAFMRWHQVLANNFGVGVSSYQKFKFWALITCILGFIIMLNLHTFILGNLVLTLFPRIKG